MDKDKNERKEEVILFTEHERKVDSSATAAMRPKFMPDSKALYTMARAKLRTYFVDKVMYSTFNRITDLTFVFQPNEDFSPPAGTYFDNAEHEL